MPYTIGMLEGFMGARDASIKQQQDQDAATRAQEGKIYEYLLGSHDPEMRALAMSGMLESARPGKKGKGLSGYLGEVQGGQIYPQVLSRMNEMVPDEGPPEESGAPAPSSSPGSAAMSTNQMTRPGSQPPQMPGTPLPPEPPPQGAAPMNDGGAAAGPMDGAQGMVGTPPPPPPSIYKRRGTGVPTAEEIKEYTERVGFENKVKTITTNIISAGGTPEDVKRAVMGMAGAPQSPSQFDAQTFGVKLPNGHTVPVSQDKTTGKYVLPDGTPYDQHTMEMVRMTGSSGGGVPRTAKEPDPQSSTGWSKVFYDITDGHELYRVDDTPFVPPPNFSGTVTTTDANGNPVNATVPRGGGPPGPANIIGPAVTGQPTQEQSDATALLTEVDKAIADAEVPRVPGLPRKPLTAAQKDQIARERASAGGLPYTSYLDIQRASRQARRPSPAPTTPKPAATPGGGGSALSLADQVRATLLQRQQAKQGQVTAVPPPPEPPARATGAGPVGR